MRVHETDVALIEWQEQKLERITIVDPRIHTGAGIRVGSTVGDIRTRLGRLSAGYDDAGVYVWSDDESGFSYLVDTHITVLLSSPDDVNEQPDIVPDTSRVRTIIFSVR